MDIHVSFYHCTDFPTMYNGIFVRQFYYKFEFRDIFFNFI